MKKICVMVLCLSPFFGWAQDIQKRNNTPVDARLYEAFDSAYVLRYLQEDPVWLERWAFYLDNAYFISDQPQTKDAAASATLPEVVIDDLSRINILVLERKQHIAKSYYTEAIYRIKGTNKYLVYYPGRDFTPKFKAHLAKKMPEAMKE